MVGRKITAALLSMIPGHSPAVSSSVDAPESFSISSDALRLVLISYVRAQESAIKWTGYTGLALSLWASLVVTDFSFKTSKYGLDGKQWQLLFIVAAIFSSIRAVTGFAAYLRRPTVESVMHQVLSKADVAREFRAICLLKYHGSDNEYRILVYKDPLWDCYLLPHYNMVDASTRDINDPHLVNFVSGEVGIRPDDIVIERIPGADLRSSKYSAHHRQGTAYRFVFFIVMLRRGVNIPAHLRSLKFTYKGRDFEWLTIAEMEDDPNTRNRNLDVTRYISDRATQLLRESPDSLEI